MLLDGYLISHFQTGLKNLLDEAILHSSDFHEQALVEKYKKLDEIPFDFTRRMMSVLVEDPAGKAILFTKGAPEDVFHQCSQFELDGKLSPMDPQRMVGLKEQYASLSNDGFRVLAVARKELPAKTPARRRTSGTLCSKATWRFSIRRRRPPGVPFRLFRSMAWRLKS